VWEKKSRNFSPEASGQHQPKRAIFDLFGYYGLICASDFGVIVPVISV